MLSKELCSELQKAGLPQVIPEGDWCQFYTQVGFGSTPEKNKWKVVWYSEKYRIFPADFKIPSLETLIDYAMEVGKKKFGDKLYYIKLLSFNDGKYYAYPMNDIHRCLIRRFDAKLDSPDEAVALLILKMLEVK